MSESLLSCKSCRRRKIKCDRTLPICSSCDKTSRVCEYPSTALRPGPAPGQHKRTQLTPKATRLHSVETFDNGQAVQQNVSPAPPTISDANGLERMLQQIGHPVFESRAYGEITPRQFDAGISNQQNATIMADSLRILGFTEETGSALIELFFEAMTAFSLFHRPTIHEKLGNIRSAKQLQALLASMFAFSLRFVDKTNPVYDGPVTAQQMLQTARHLVTECLEECTNVAPPLHLLQSLILSTFQFVIQGVQGRTWRMVGDCVRIAYELRLHQIDNSAQRNGGEEPASSEVWLVDEERRRAWWATWELDVFASHATGLPLGIDPLAIGVWLPSHDKAWYQNKPVTSCHLNPMPEQRWKDLRDSGNVSANAWFIVLDTYKWEASKSKVKQSLLENCIRCATMALPESLTPGGHYLAFRKSEGPYNNLDRLEDHGRFAIDIIIQVSQLLMCRSSLQEETTSRNQRLSENSSDAKKRTQALSMSWQRSFTAADSIAQTIRNAALYHFQYVNPCLSSVIWMAAVVYIAGLVFRTDILDEQLARSNLDLIREALSKFVRFWGAPSTLIESLDMLEGQFGRLNQGNRTRGLRDPLDPSHDQTTGVGQQSVFRSIDNGSNEVGDPGRATKEGSEAIGAFPLSTSYELDPSDVLQAMDFGAMFNGIEDWENLFLNSEGM